MPLTQGEKSVEIGPVLQRGQYEGSVGLLQRGSICGGVCCKHLSTVPERLLEEADQIVAPAGTGQHHVHRSMHVTHCSQGGPPWTPGSAACARGTGKLPAN